MAMRMDGDTVHIQEIETVADRKGKLMRVEFEYSCGMAPRKLWRHALESSTVSWPNRAS